MGSDQLFCVPEPMKGQTEVFAVISYNKKRIKTAAASGITSHLFSGTSLFSTFCFLILLQSGSERLTAFHTLDL